MRLLTFLLAACAAHAEFLRLEVSMADMNCPSCSESLGKAFEKMRGVKHVEVNMKDGTVTLDLADQNRVAIEQVWDAIKRVGFTPGDSKVTVRGSVKAAVLTVSVIDKTIAIDGQTVEADNVELKGVIPQPPDPRTPLKLRIVE